MRLLQQTEKTGRHKVAGMESMFRGAQLSPLSFPETITGDF